MAEELPEALIRGLRERLARLADEVTAKQRKRAQLDEEVSRAEALMEAYERVLHAEQKQGIEHKQMGDGIMTVFSHSDQGVEFASSSQPTIPQAITAVLVERNRAMHADEIVAELQKRGMRLSTADPKASVVTALVRGAKRGIFEKVSPNRYRVRPPPIGMLDVGATVEALNQDDGGDA